MVDGEPLVALVRPSADFSDALPAGLSAELARLVDAMAACAAAAQAPNTTKAYQSDWRQFEHWAGEHRLAAMPTSPSPVTDPRVLIVLEGIARTHGTAPTKKVALLRDPLLEPIDRIDPSTPAGLRDRALLLLGFALGLRRSELVAVSVEHLPPTTTA